MAILVGACASPAATQPSTSAAAIASVAAAATAAPAPPAPAPAAPAPPTAPAPPPPTVDGTFVDLANAKRASVGLPPVSASALLDAIAAERAAAMAGGNSMSHDLGYVLQRLTGTCQLGYAEIIATESGQASFSVQRTIDAWWASPTHHAIMVGSFNATGGGWAQAANGSYYAAMVFATLC